MRRTRPIRRNRVFQESAVLRPVGHRDQFTSLNSLATASLPTFSHQGNVRDFHDASVLNQEALALWPSQKRITYLLPESPRNQ
ncbi:hypothetical protein DEU56DRAFT_771158 [Suillus clintonianus]|uniref:uncharacterized protein n=1 Tax=Suillus clintonianus TaxID=1904413 RepID=UPI001B874C0E|nr:uncharacterized protein DEU56DRAFT_771158 [Suillus clintonianus]KAG2153808.1 hypothetical protein DEU56DRAFT_771158 [Suillus clintonianus]